MNFRGVCLTWLYSCLPQQGRPVLSGVKSGLAGAAILFGYVAFAEPAKYIAPSIRAWIAVGGLASLAQFTLSGILLRLIHGPWETAEVEPGGAPS